MPSSVFLHPSAAFKEVLDNPKRFNPWGIIILAGVFLALIGYMANASPVIAVFFFVANLIQWLVFTIIVWFFEFVHVKKRKALASTAFGECAAVTGKFWKINLAGNLLVAVMFVIYPLMSQDVFSVIGIIGFVLGMALAIIWLIASYKLLKEVTGIAGAKLFVNWIILVVLNLVTTSFIVALITKLL